MENNLEKITNHFQFLGYEVEKLDKEQDNKIFVARSSSKNNFTFVVLDGGIVLFRIMLTDQKSITPEIESFINKINNNTVSKVFCSVNSENLLIIHFDLIYAGEYKKETFGQFIDIMNNDVVIFSRDPDFNKAFVS